MRGNRGGPAARAVSQRAPLTTLLSVALVTALVTGACGGNDDGSRGTPAKCGFDDGARCQPESKRVDRAKPSFSNPTDITNPRFPVSALDQVVQLGEEGDKSSRVEATRLPATKTIEWNGRPVDTVVQQYIAYLDGRIIEVALDYYAQADDGAVWYFGEDVSNYKDGVIVDHEGTWLAGKDGPPGMIMPAQPKVGDVYRPENIPGLVFEEDTVKSTGETVDGPRGRVEGAIVIQEHLMDNSLEEKVFAPGYGEFRTRTGDESAATALAVPIDARGEPPAELDVVSSGASQSFEAAGSGDWNAASAGVTAASNGWAGLRAKIVPPLLGAQLRGAIDDLARGVGAQDAAAARSAAIDVAHAGLDIRLRHRPPSEIDLGRLELWTRQLLVDAGSGDPGAVAGDVATLETIRDRIAHTLGSTLGQINDVLRDLRTAADRKDLSAARAGGTRLRETLLAHEPRP